MNEKTLSELRGWFDTYVEAFKPLDEEMYRSALLKEEHTRLVCEAILAIGRDLGLEAEDLVLAEIIGLLHDVGRFEQFARYRTFVDCSSVNHAHLGVQILERHGVLEGLDDARRQLVLRVISYHNCLCLPQNETEACLFFGRLLRDADKLDIYRLATGYYRRMKTDPNETIGLAFPNTPGFSDDVHADLMMGKPVPHARLRNLNDFKMVQMAWAHDVNFVPTLRRIRDRGYVRSIRDTLPESEEIDALLRSVESYVARRIDDGNGTSPERRLDLS